MSIRSPRTNNRRLATRSRRSDQLLEVQVRSSTARRRRRQFVWRWTFRLIFLALLAAGSFYGVREGLDRFFFNNPDYNLARINMELDGVMTREEALAETGLREGENIFRVNLADVESVFRALPEVQDVTISRGLPDRIDIKVTTRRPVAWVAPADEIGDPTASERALLVDDAGIMMRPRRLTPEHYHLPVIYGVNLDNLHKGEPLDSADLKVALDFLSTLNQKADSLLKVRTLNISRGYSLEVINDENARIIFASSDFDQQLDRLQQLLLHCAESGRVLDSVNLMVKRNTPVTFVVAAMPEVPEPATGKPTKKLRKN
jgi:cell division septal protein FtsQ